MERPRDERDEPSGFRSTWYGVNDVIQDQMERLVDELPGDNEVARISGEVAYDWISVYVYFEDGELENWTAKPADKPTGGAMTDVGEKWTVTHYQYSETAETVHESELFDELATRIREFRDE